MPVILPYEGKAPRIAPSAWVAEGAVVAGDVELGDESSVWFGSVVRGDVNHVRVGARTNIQDQSVVHVTGGTHPTVIGDDVTVGHRAVLHGCTVHDRCLVGIGAIVLDGAVVGPDAMIGAGALVPPGAVVPPGTLVLGAPAKPKRSLTPEEVAFLKRSAASYVSLAARHREPGGSPP
jgi:carbonic anhydrase/acetyltransferase-like protein (isoleucine patch superfamily)